jgi:hypothetical protein
MVCETDVEAVTEDDRWPLAGDDPNVGGDQAAGAPADEALRPFTSDLGAGPPN